MNQTLLEFVDSRGVAIRVDRAAGVMRGVKILGLRSRNGREYLPQALAAAAALYEGAKVNVNHPKGHPTAPRDYQDRIGVIRGVAVRPGEGLFGDFHFNPKHALAEQLVWDAEHAAENVGFSHNVEARTRRQGEATVVEAITRVQSVDLVADPATTRSLFESQQAGGGDEHHTQTPALAAWSELTLEALQGQRGDLCRQLVATHETQAAAAHLARIRVLETENADLRRGARQALVSTLLGEYRLPDPAIDQAAAQSLLGTELLEQLQTASDEAALRQLLSARARLIEQAQSWSAAAHQRHAGRPRSRDQSTAHASPPLDARNFAKSISA